MQRDAEHFLGIVFFHRKATRYWSVTMDASRYCNRFVRIHTTIAFAIVASTVLEKQYYTIDLVAGAFV